jgi:predicted signal transduction protein with EAL and GGDEF domain
VLDASGVAAADLVIEVTETGVLEDLERAAEVLQQLHDLGVRIHVDDFGTGYSSMTYVQRFPVDGLKVDRSFVAGLGTSAGDAAIVASTLGLARATNLTVTAEGVESQEQADLLIAAGCHLAQGYLWSRPLPQDRWLAVQDAASGEHPTPSRGRPGASPEALRRILELHAVGASASTIAAALNRERLPRSDGLAQWHRTSVAAVVTQLGQPRR